MRVGVITLSLIHLADVVVYFFIYLLFLFVCFSKKKKVLVFELILYWTLLDIKRGLESNHLSLIDCRFLSVLSLHTNLTSFTLARCFIFGSMAISTAHCAVQPRRDWLKLGAAGSQSQDSDWRSLPLCARQLLLSAAVFRMVVLNDCRDAQGLGDSDWLRLGFQKTYTWSLIGWRSLCARGVSAAAF